MFHVDIKRQRELRSYLCDNDINHMSKQCCYIFTCMHAVWVRGRGVGTGGGFAPPVGGLGPHHSSFLIH